MIYTLITYSTSILLMLTPQIKPITRLKIICTIFTCYSALRYDFGWDYFNYVNLINSDQYHRFEPIPFILASLSRLSSPQFFFISTSIIIGCAIYGIYKNLYQKIPMLLLGFCLFFFLPIGFTISVDKIRQFVAIFLLLYAATCPTRKQKGLFVVFSLLFHYASIIYVPFVLFPRLLLFKTPKTIIILICLLSFLIFPNIFPIVLSSIGRYSDYLTFSSSQGNKILLLYILIGGFLMINQRKIFMNKIALYFYNMFFLGLIIYLSLSPFGIHLTRIAYFPLLSTPILISYLLMFKSKNYQVMCLISAILLVIASHYFASFDPIRDPLNNYDLFFFHDLSKINNNNV